MLGVAFVAFAICFVVERAAPGWSLPSVRSWPLRVLLTNAIQVCVVMAAGVTGERWRPTARRTPPGSISLALQFVCYTESSSRPMWLSEVMRHFAFRLIVRLGASSSRVL